MGKLPKKKTYILTKLARKAELDAEREDAAKALRSKRGLKVWFMQRARAMLDNINPLEVAAIFGATIAIKQSIDWIESSKAHLGEAVAQASPLYWIFPQVREWISGMKETTKEGAFPDWLDWLLAFVAAYILVKHFGMIAETAGNLGKIAAGMMFG